MPSVLVRLLNHPELIRGCMPYSSGADPSTISVVVPCYNAKGFLREAVESALSQTRPPLEVIVVDDCSTDSSLDVIDDLPVVRVRNATNLGQSASRNVGVSLAKGDYVATLDADDVWLPEHLEKVAVLLDGFPDVAVACSAIEMFGARSDVVRPGFEEKMPVELFQRVFTGCAIPHATTVLRRAMVGDRPYAEHGETSYSEDYTLWLALSQQYPFACTHDVTVRYRVHEGQLSRNRHKQLASKYAVRKQVLRNSPDAADLRDVMHACWSRDLRDAWQGRNAESLAVLGAVAADQEFGSPWRLTQARAAAMAAPHLWPRIDQAKQRLKALLGRS